MGLFNKIKDILFDEETVEIPVITKEKETKKTYKKKDDDDDLIIEEIKTESEEELFDMPKLKEEAEEEVRTSAFTFPVFDEDDEDDILGVTRSKSREEKKPEKRYGGFDFLSSTSYKSKGEKNKYDRVSYYEPEPKKPFKPSPVISPVYGILNENYKKEDIVTRSEAPTRLSSEKLDLDSVRKKAYGTLEDEIEESLNKTLEIPEVFEEVPTKEELTLEDLSDEGISIDDLLIDEKIKDSFEDEEIDLDIFDDGQEEIKEKKNDADDDDLFDLIDSLYAEEKEND